MWRGANYCKRIGLNKVPDRPPSTWGREQVDPQKTKEKQLKSVNYKRRSRSGWKIIQDEKYIPWNIVSVISSFELFLLAIIPFGDNNFTAGCPFVRRIAPATVTKMMYLSSNGIHHNIGGNKWCFGISSFNTYNTNLVASVI